LSDDFETLIDSLGDMALDLLGSENLVEVRITADEVLRTAEVVACMDHEPGDDEYRRLLQKLVEVREFYLDDLALSIAVETGSPGAPRDDPGVTGTRQFAYAY
jgi:hypothetical protein